MFTEDTSAYLADFGVACTGPGAVAFRALFDQPDVLVQLVEARNHSREFEIRHITTAITLARNDAVQVADPVSGSTLSFTVREPSRRLGDGMFSSVILTRA